jgi:acyl dehydratase
VTFRLSLGIGELMHGLVRLPIVATFAADMAKGFEGTILPGWFVYSLWVGASVFGGADRNFAYF